MPISRNPSWTRDELILALDLYFRFNPRHISKSHPEVVALSRVLNLLAIHTELPDPDRFRNPNGVYMKMCNFLRLDGSYSGVGLKAGGKADADVWREFADKKDLLHDVALAIRAGVKNAAPPAAGARGEEDEEEISAPEGRLLFRQHRQRERNPSLTRQKKQRCLQAHGVLRCEICGFVYAELYGQLGDGYMECHHTKPLHQLSPGQKTMLKDLSLICANCHRMLHRGGDFVGMATLREIVVRNRNPGPLQNSRGRP